MPFHRSGSCPGGTSCASHRPDHRGRSRASENTKGRRDPARARERERERERNSQREFSELLLDDVVRRVPRYTEQFVIVLGPWGRGCPQQTVVRGKEHEQEEDSRSVRQPSGTHPNDDDLGVTFGRWLCAAPRLPQPRRCHDPPAPCASKRSATSQVLCPSRSTFRALHSDPQKKGFGSQKNWKSWKSWKSWFGRLSWSVPIPNSASADVGNVSFWFSDFSVYDSSVRTYVLSRGTFDFVYR